ncbi:MAG: hypothetical protein V1928_03130 [Parcubacteria group bacterium]
MRFAQWFSLMMTFALAGCIGFSKNYGFTVSQGNIGFCEKIERPGWKSEAKRKCHAKAYQVCKFMPVCRQEADRICCECEPK